MPIEQPYPGLGELLEMTGAAGRRVCDIDASEGAAGNISVYIGWPIEPRRVFPNVRSMNLPQVVPELAGGSFLVTGSGRRLREIMDDPAANLAFLRVDEGGRTAQVYTSPRCLFERLTSEFNSHLAVHYDQVMLTRTVFHTIVHAQPLHLTYLSHIPRYQDETYLNRHLLRWQPEMIINLPEGLGYVPFSVPGSPELMAATVEGLRKHRLVLWAKHGVMARSDASAKRAVDRIEYAESGARYECLNLGNQELAEGLSAEEIRAICRSFEVEQSVY
jgi:rhamnulose-1-phosphate aldolase